MQTTDNPNSGSLIMKIPSTKYQLAKTSHNLYKAFLRLYLPFTAAGNGIRAAEAHSLSPCGVVN